MHPATVEAAVHADDIRANVVFGVGEQLVYLVLDAPAALDAFGGQRYGYLDVGEAHGRDLERVGAPRLLIHTLNADGLLFVRNLIPIERLPVLVFLIRVPTVPHDIREVHGDIGRLGQIAVLIDYGDNRLWGGKVHLPQFEHVVLAELVPESFEAGHVSVVEVREEPE
ncbi:hypothetical protein [Halobellus marinus]|uniref:hypothetical protein n=1 Tax=Halobellus marinus TaxID=3075123 RepID=UPI0028B0D0EA|nr:hypothetical protein [Halobellus sp. DFY28]